MQIWRPQLKNGPSTIRTLLFILVLFLASCIYSLWIDTSKVSTQISAKNTVVIFSEKHQNPVAAIIEYPLNCTTAKNQTQTCPTDYPKTFTTLQDQDPSSSGSQVCPNYFRWIHEDLRPWKATGITRDMVERAKTTAHFRLVILNGKAYIEKYKQSIQTRDKFTIWGILQLLRRYPGRIPDLELMFDCDDQPVVRSSDHRGPNKTSPPPLFRYCGDKWTMDIVFPDWSFWGWAEINIKPWDKLLKDLDEGNQRSKWIDREPYAYWKGNPYVAENRQNLLTCNVSDEKDWNARLFIQDWILESQQGYKQSDLASQCTYRYKIYIEGYAWSVSEKYILACDSVTLLVKPRYYDFFTRSLQPVEHYWPVRDNDKCKSIKFAVDWGNRHKQKAQAIGKAASDFIQRELKMEYVYDYMFHALNEYAKLLKFVPQVPEGAVELCSESLACSADGLERKFMTESLVKSPAVSSPCNLPPPYEPHDLGRFYRRNLNLVRQVEKWEDQYWS
ncbi:hypothetical protein Tsubulata_010282 [Turnera subulata]|uniref:Glycosyl transferase CAP10 domain-containing protein n=1 Tax=Turnera subulata TaxID=218843 RepID=A0A9Q0FIG7_9ROSI|nr:hypothetical protein Tsubulata_010282 [Turnera subulata]